MFAGILSALGTVGEFLKLLGFAMGWLHDERQTQIGVQLQAGHDAEEALSDAQKDIAARDAVVPLRSDGLMRDGTKDPGQRD